MNYIIGLYFITYLYLIMPDIKLDLLLEPAQVDALVQQRADAKPIKPELSETALIRKPEAYKRFQDIQSKQQYRDELINSLKQTWESCYGKTEADILLTTLRKLQETLNENGAVIFAELIANPKFSNLVTHYDSILQTSGSKSWIHSYVNLANHPEFLNNPDFNAAFLHPLLIVLISYQIGGPIRMVDARAKDAEPISVLAQDNMLHIDNTPFNDEYKIILTWEKGKASGPKGQNFVYIPGTQKGARNCFVSEDKKAWSTENASIFIDKDSIQQVFDLQQKVSTQTKPTVVEVHHDQKPLTTVFAAGSLVHHRFRTEEGLARSCMIIAFHRTKDNPGQLITNLPSSNNDLNASLLANQNQKTATDFIQTVCSQANNIAEKLLEINAKKSGIEIVEQQQRELSEQALQKWKAVATQAPTVENLKVEESFFPLKQTLSAESFTKLLGDKMMMFDKHGPLDLILYGDNHEEPRKWARNRIREMKHEKLTLRLANWTLAIEQPNTNHLLTPKELQDIANQLVTYVNNLKDQSTNVLLDKEETISPKNAYRSVRQLLIDLGEAIMRCETRQAFLSTSLFLFWACDELLGFEQDQHPLLLSIGKQLLANYIATYILIEKQIRHELSLKPSNNTQYQPSFWENPLNEDTDDAPAIAIPICGTSSITPTL